MEQFSNGAFLGHHPMPYFKIPRTEKYGMRCARGNVVSDKGKKHKIAGKPSIHNVDYLFGQTDEYLILNMIS